MTTLALNYSRLQKNVKAKVESVALPTANWKAILFVALLGVFISLSFYAWQINSLTKGAYLINSYQNEIAKLTDDNKNLQASFAESSFLGHALAQVEGMSFEKTTSVKYIKIMDNFVATAR
ncbi:MAG: hypothetical protein A2599_03655 [Candidatus Staskawiczbacteria bacterium RIFOXYD1_FULL_39_28]|uniref:Uncharacterized protein n=1 Tax=Candidatus Staskawiczbacteria bacterium RIFOXYC1_FULL_38_18 TaxID=1802229 RepID=A0A1G2JDV8_9BACT|nr:MAG: hypothetical protein A2401_01540 [Candidatus Staskawiczbacteria bacterium RIFOXYC1_FULL_38_18]OGZ91534.1 MAG: hypothetical protein A2599_03655 [Candidatus Staskawiczbacteria bacterium RIFOXYD1_FULL_39_28]